MTREGFFLLICFKPCPCQFIFFSKYFFYHKKFGLLIKLKKKKQLNKVTDFKMEDASKTFQEMLFGMKDLNFCLFVKVIIVLN